MSIIFSCAILHSILLWYTVKVLNHLVYLVQTGLFVCLFSYQVLRVKYLNLLSQRISLINNFKVPAVCQGLLFYGLGI